MTSIELLVEAFQRIRDELHPAVNGLSPDELAFRPEAESNSIAWLAWHLTRIQDDHVAGLDGSEQVWMAKGWKDRFGLPLDPFDTGYGHDPETVAKVTADAASLLGYYEDVHGKTVFLALLGLPLLLVPRARRMRRMLLLLLFGVLATAGTLGCGGNHGLLYTPAGGYQYQVTATSTSGTQIKQTVTLNLMVQ